MTQQVQPESTAAMIHRLRAQLWKARKSLDRMTKEHEVARQKRFIVELEKELREVSAKW